MITIQALVRAPLERVWTVWTTPEHIMQWNAAADTWHCPSATNDLRVGGVFHATMAARDGSASFDFSGTYTEVVPFASLAYVMLDGRRVSIAFTPEDGGVLVTETFDPEAEHSEEFQRQGWQAILDRFARYTEAQSV